VWVVFSARIKFLKFLASPNSRTRDSRGSATRKNALRIIACVDYYSSMHAVLEGMHAGRAHRRVVTTYIHYQIGDPPMTVGLKFENPLNTLQTTELDVSFCETTKLNVVCVVLQDDTIMCRLDLSFCKTTK
jgi:hypothetical protein